MVTFFEAGLQQLSIHQEGNKLMDEKYTLSKAPYSVQDETLNKLLMQYFLFPFEKTNEMYHFSHSSGNLELNEMYHFAAQVFTDTKSFHENSRQITKHLYEVSDHPKIKGGELYVAYFKDLQVEGGLHDAIGIFKSETK